MTPAFEPMPVYAHGSMETVVFMDSSSVKSATLQPGDARGLEKEIVSSARLTTRCVSLHPATLLSFL